MNIGKLSQSILQAHVVSPRHRKPLQNIKIKYLRKRTERFAAIVNPKAQLQCAAATTKRLVLLIFSPENGFADLLGDE
jgi:hypothetical protein